MEGQLYYFENTYREIGNISLIVINRNAYGEPITEYQVRKLQVNGSSICTAFNGKDMDKALNLYYRLVEQDTLKAS